MDLVLNKVVRDLTDSKFRRSVVFSKKTPHRPSKFTLSVKSRKKPTDLRNLLSVKSRTSLNHSSFFQECYTLLTLVVKDLPKMKRVAVVDGVVWCTIAVISLSSILQQYNSFRFNRYSFSPSSSSSLSSTILNFKHKHQYNTILTESNNHMNGIDNNIDVTDDKDIDDDDDDIMTRSVRKLDEKPILTLIEPYSNSRIHLIGVSHGSEASAMLVNNKIKSISPSVVILELCDERYFSICLEKKMKPNINNDTIIELYNNKLKLMNKIPNIYNNNDDKVDDSHDNKQKRIKFFQQLFRRNTLNSSSISSISSTSSSISFQATNKQTSRFIKSMIEYLNFMRLQGLIVGSFISMGMLVSTLQRIVRQSEQTDDEFVTAMKVTTELNIPIRLGTTYMNASIL